MKKLFVIPIMLIMVIHLASAFTFINIFVDGSGNAIFLGETNENPELPTGVTLKDNEISGLTSSLTSKEGDVWEFLYTLEGSELTVTLPVGARILETNAKEIFLNNGRISLYVIDEINVKYVIEKNGGSVFPTSRVPIVVVLLSILLIFIVFIINYNKREKAEHEKEMKEMKKEKEKDNLEVLKHVLNDREKAIIKKLKETGKIKGSQLRKLVDIPKASFSRHVQELEKKKLIKRTGEGKNKFVELIK